MTELTGYRHITEAIERWRASGLYIRLKAVDGCSRCGWNAIKKLMPIRLWNV